MLANLSVMCYFEIKGQRFSEPANLAMKAGKVNTRKEKNDEETKEQELFGERISKRGKKGGFPILKDWGYNKRRSFDDNRKSKMV